MCIVLSLHRHPVCIVTGIRSVNTGGSAKEITYYHPLRIYVRTLHRMIAVMNMKKKILRNVSHALSVPEEICCRIPVVTIRGKDSVTVENHMGLLSYGETCMMIACNGEILCVRGMELSVSFMGKEVVHLTGKIEGVQWK